MLVSYLWLKELADFDFTPEELAAALTGLGLETSIADDRRGGYENIVIGKVIQVDSHPDADKLSVCKVDTGSGMIKTIVCGAPNVAVGQAVPVALEGAVMPDGMKIKNRKVRGVASEGMIASEAELRFSDNHDGIMVLDDDPEPGEKFSDRYEACDVIVELDLTPNRGDCLGMIGVAREVAAVAGAGLGVKRPPTLIKESAEKVSKRLSVEISAPDLCPRYAGRVITGLQVAPSPFWMRRRLFALGVRSINNLVDITNYVLLETGHPLHAFDDSKIDGGAVIVRRAKNGEKFTSLDGKEHELNSENLVIADKKQAIALAGVMGGANSEVTESTTSVILESAFFNPVSIRRTSRQLNIKSESSFRFERGCDVEGLIYAQDRAVSLMSKLCGGSALKGRVDAYPSPVAKTKVTLRYQRADQILGIKTSKERVKEIFTRLEMEPVGEDESSVTVEAPHFRFDIEREIDLIEEVVRFVGFDRIEPNIPEVPASAESMSHSLTARRDLRRHLRSLGMMEGMSYSFMSETDLDKLRLPTDSVYRKLINIDNPLSSEWTHLRSTLIPGLLTSASNADDCKLFEIGVVFTDDGDENPPVERWLVSGVITETVKPGLWSGRAGRRDFYHLKGIVESVIKTLGCGKVEFKPSDHPFYYPKRQADVVAGSVTLGHFGQAHPKTLGAYEAPQELFLFEIDLDRLLAVEAGVKMFTPINKFPSVKRDLAVVVPESVTVERLTVSIRKHGAKRTREAALFDIYSGDKVAKGSKSVAFSLEFSDDEKTLTDEEANAIFEKILKGLEKDCGARLR
ncbi:Phenylalanyl-tRNA synthetase beta chain [hydrothermal vent metagenome]|uniref:Phenylalanine--tRNA ligase beta subunit n=1 Tax=hydrothermal vent metagenome TaxID=652676 RepID=A0A3B1BFV7_9ZZZZ